MSLTLRNLIIIFFSFSCLSFSGESHKRPGKSFVQFPKSFEAQISVSANDGDFVRARKNAFSLATKDVLKQALDYLLEDSVQKINKRTLKKIISNASQYVKSYSFLYAEDNLDDMNAEVGLEITLYFDALKKNLRSLGILSESESQSAVVILIRAIEVEADQGFIFGDYIPTPETVLTQKFAVAGVPVLPRNELKDLVAEEVVLKAIQGDLGAAVEIGTQVGVDIVILGNAASSKLKSLRSVGLENVQVNVSVKAISVSKGTVIAAKSDFASAQGEGLLEGELKAYKEVSERLSTFLLNSFKQLNKNSEKLKSTRPSGLSRSPMPFNDL